MKKTFFQIALVFAIVIPALRAQDAGDEAAELAKQLSNPVANLISVPLQANWDFGIGPNDVTRFTLNGACRPGLAERGCQPHHPHHPAGH